MYGALVRYADRRGNKRERTPLYFANGARDAIRPYMKL